MMCPVKFYRSHPLGNSIAILVFVLILLIWAFHWDAPLFYTINRLHVFLPDSVWLGLNFLAYTRYGILAIILLILTFFFRRDKFRNVILLTIAFYVVFSGLKFIVGEARPYTVLPHDSFFWLNKFESALHNAYRSFPSGHTGGMAIFVFSLMCLFFPKSKFAQTLLFLLLIITGLARICTGWHWPIDVLTSGLIGYILVRIFLPLPDAACTLTPFENTHEPISSIKSRQVDE